jgi:hypothetical protein
MTEAEMEAKIKEMEAQLVILPRKKWNVIKNIVLAGIAVVVLPFMPSRHGTTTVEDFGLKNTIIFGALFYIVLVVWAVNANNRKVEYEISSLEVDIETLKRKKKELLDKGNSI